MALVGFQPLLLRIFMSAVKAVQVEGHATEEMVANGFA